MATIIFENSNTRSNKIRFNNSAMLFSRPVNVTAILWEKGDYSRVYIKLSWSDGSRQNTAGYYCLNTMQFVTAGLKGSARWNAEQVAKQVFSSPAIKLGDDKIQVVCKSSLMRRAWQIRKAQGLGMSEAMKQAWAEGRQAAQAA